MKVLTSLILILFSTSSLAELNISAVEKKQRKLVSRYYEALELLPSRCPKLAREEYMKTVEKFEKAYPEFISLTRESNFRSYAIENFSENTTPVSEDACLFYKQALDMQVDEKKEQKRMHENTEIMRKTG